ncbi:MAG: hypothetical protein LBT19_02030 [Candidatus Nomurabacteria bacterium]|jgi:ComF family protein|nr:hypothetical protein [Candidatus Nomurabacteria bacterium]
MIDQYKYHSVRAYSDAFASLISSILPKLPQDTIIIPVPTIQRHVRERGFDHTLLIAKQLARIQRLSCEAIIGRAKNTIQVGAAKQLRINQAKAAYKIITQPTPETHYLIIDDVWTTGSSICSICNLLKKAGAHHLMVAVLARSGTPDTTLLSHRQLH